MNVASGTGRRSGRRPLKIRAIGVDLNQDNDQPGHVVTSMVVADTASLQRIESVVYQEEFSKEIPPAI